MSLNLIGPIGTPKIIEAQPDAPLVGGLKVEVISGSATFNQDPTSPLEFTIFSEDVPGTSTYRVTGTDGTNTVTDTVTFTYEAPVPPLTTLNLREKVA